MKKRQERECLATWPKFSRTIAQRGEKGVASDMIKMQRQAGTHQEVSTAVIIVNNIVL